MQQAPHQVLNPLPELEKLITWADTLYEIHTHPHYGFLAQPRDEVAYGWRLYKRKTIALDPIWRVDQYWARLRRIVADYAFDRMRLDSTPMGIEIIDHHDLIARTAAQLHNIVVSSNSSAVGDGVAAVDQRIRQYKEPVVVLQQFRNTAMMVAIKIHKDLIRWNSETSPPNPSPGDITRGEFEDFLGFSVLTMTRDGQTRKWPPSAAGTAPTAAAMPATARPASG